MSYPMTTIGTERYYCSSQQIADIKHAIEALGMRAITWQSVAARPDTIEPFLRRCRVALNGRGLK